MAVRTQIVSAARPGVSSVFYIDLGITSRTEVIPNIGAVTSTGAGIAPGAAHMDGVGGAYFIPNVPLAPGAAHMDGTALVDVHGQTGTTNPGAAEMDGVGGAYFISINTVSGVAQMDGATNVAYVGSWNIAGQGQMDGLTTVSFAGGIGAAAAQMDGKFLPAFMGKVTGGADHGAAQMDGATHVFMSGEAVVFAFAAAEMDGQGSMLGVQAGNPLPPHGIILSAGI